MMKKVLLLILTAVLLVSCQNYKKLEFGDFSLGKVQAPRLDQGEVALKLNMKANVKNPTSSAYLLKKMDAILYSKGGAIFADVYLAEGEKPGIAPHSDSVIEIPLKVNLANPMSLLTLGLSGLNDIKNKGLSVDYKITVGSGLFSKTYQGKAVPVKDFIEMLEQKMKK